MASLRDVVAKAHGLVPDAPTGPVLEDYYAPRHRQWLELSDAEREWSPAAVEHARKVFAGEYVRERSARFSPSSIGTDCKRELLFSFAGAPQIPSQPINVDKMESGSFEHLRWQMEGLTAGWLTDVEVWVHVPEMQCGGSADGRGDDGSLFEFKNTAPHLFEPIATGRGRAIAFAERMVAKYKLQMEAYWLLDEVAAQIEGRDRFFTDEGSLVFQNTGTKDVHEIRLRSDLVRRAKVLKILEEVTDWVDLNQLPDMLPGCVMSLDTTASPSWSDQRVFTTCAYRKHCPSADTVRLA